MLKADKMCIRDRAYIGAAAAYMHGEEWLEQLLDYIKGNIDFTENYLREHIPGIGDVYKRQQPAIPPAQAEPESRELPLL